MTSYGQFPRKNGLPRADFEEVSIPFRKILHGRQSVSG
jgi:hypothetical protein